MAGKCPVMSQGEEQEKHSKRSYLSDVGEYLFPSPKARTQTE